MKKFALISFIATSILLGGCFEQKEKSSDSSPAQNSRDSNARATYEAIKAARSKKFKPARRQANVSKKADKDLPLPPNPEAMRAPVLRGERIKPVLAVENSADREKGKFIVPYFKAGNKSVYVRRNGKGQDRTFDGAEFPRIFINGEGVATFQFWGVNKLGFGYPFPEIKGDPFIVEADEKAGVYTYKKPYLDNDGKRCVFVLKMSVDGKNRIEVSWDTGSDLGAAPWIHFSGYRGKVLSFGGKPLPQNSKEAFDVRKTINTRASGNVEFNGGSPTTSFKIIWENGDSEGDIAESYEYKHLRDNFSMTYRSAYACKNKSNSSGKFYIDLGECAQEKDVPPAVRGMDFWGFDLTHVPLAPTRNIMPNSGFEQGVRYWKYKNDGSAWSPDLLPAGQIVSDAHSGKKAMRINGRGAMMSMPMSLLPNKNYVVSFWHKSALDHPRGGHCGLQSASRGGLYMGKYGRGDGDKSGNFSAKPNLWQRHERKFKGDPAGICLCFSGYGIIVDDIQIEEVPSENSHATEYVASPFDGNFVTSDPDNDISFGSEISAAMEIFGKPSTEGNVTVSIKNMFYENLFKKTYPVKLDADGFARVPVELDSKKLGQGIFSVRADYAVSGFPKYTDYFRFAVMKKLSNTHPTKNIFGTGMFTSHHFDMDYIGRRFMQWGFGSGSWYNPVQGQNWRENIKKRKHETDVFIKYRYASTLFNTHTQYSTISVIKELESYPYYKKWEKVTPELEKLIEEEAFLTVSNYPKEMLWAVAFGNEEEDYTAGRYDDFVKAQYAVYKGAKRANPNVLVAPTNGTSGYNMYRGRDAIDGYLAAANKLGFKYDVLAIHPYGNADIDPVWDFDENLAYLISRMKHYGYPDSTPILLTEGGNMCDANIPPWNTHNLDFYGTGKPTYDFSNQEIFQACIYARCCLAALKYYPKVQGMNHWTYEPFLDISMTPTLWCKAVNTLGNLYGDVKFVADVRPSAKIRSYVFDTPDGSAIAALWCTDVNVLRSRAQSPVMRVKFQCPVEFFDFYGNPRKVDVDRNGVTTLHVSPMPLSIKAKSSKLLAESLRDAEVEDTSSDVRIRFAPQSNGAIRATLENATGRRMKGSLFVGDKEFPYVLSPKGARTSIVSECSESVEFGKLYSWSQMYRIKPERGVEIGNVWKSDFFFIPQKEGKIDWSNVPAMPLDNRLFESDATKRKFAPKDNVATYKLAWDAENLYLRVEVKDSKVETFPEIWKENPTKARGNLYWFDGSLNICFDIANDGRASRAYNTNDYVYHIAPPADCKTGKGYVWRWHDVDYQLADGMNHATQDEVGEKVVCNYTRTKDGFVYDIVFAKRYIMPLKLSRGTACGFALFLHDRDRDNNGKVNYSGLSNATERGVHIDNAPHFWPQMILK